MMNQTPDNAACEKIILADSLGVRLYYCPNCEVVELELGSISIRLSPSSIQSIANIMMKASLRLDAVYQHPRQARTTQVERREEPDLNEMQRTVTPQLVH
ncbi:hypothetical protein [Methylotenera sp. N17]|uniref:hypothetical protein n=1 Tax=Methylotenera sp. N17 TaxID=1502761 RepID=UPI00126A7372|nr:hypothetical protein [Methylotenera sp. N17]